jgi:hypothetical protein
MPMTLSKNKLIITAFQEVAVADALNDLAAVAELLCSTEEGTNHYGLFFIHKLFMDNLEMLAKRLTGGNVPYPEPELFSEDEAMTEDD